MLRQDSWRVVLCALRRFEDRGLIRGGGSVAGSEVSSQRVARRSTRSESSAVRLERARGRDPCHRSDETGSA
jgi:hypothetical protein